MSVNLILFLVLAVIAIAAAIGMIISRSAVYSALFLIINFGTVAVFYLVLGAPFIALAQVTVYAGAIMVLFLFVIMLLGAERLNPVGTLPWQQPLALVLGVALIIEAAYLMVTRTGTLDQAAASAQAIASGPSDIGLFLFNQYLLPFEVTSILLLVAMVGAIVLTHKPKKGI